MKFASVDIETTGLDPNKDVILEIAAGIGEVKPLTSFLGPKEAEAYVYSPLANEIRIIVLPEGDITACLRVLAMHANLFVEMARYEKDMGRDKQVIKVEGDRQFVAECGEQPAGGFYVVRRAKAWPIFHAWFRKVQPDGMMNCAGKNFAGFDARFLRRLDPSFDEVFRPRVIDPATLYYRRGDDRTPSTETCLARLKAEWPSMPPYKQHGALDDARAIAWLVRAGLMRSPETPPRNDGILVA